jgi:hypothetical protein
MFNCRPDGVIRGGGGSSIGRAGIVLWKAKISMVVAPSVLVKDGLVSVSKY